MAAASTTSAHVSRAKVLRWLRRVHGWLGLWGAVLGLLFGVTGFLLNHRAVMKIPALKMEQSQFEIAMPANAPKNAQEFAHLMQREFELKQPAYKVHDEPSRPVAWGDKKLVQPAQWKAEFHLPHYSLSAEYWVGNQFVSVKRQDVNAWGFLMRMHKGTGMNAGWILLVDSLAGAMLVLSITGVLLWTKMRGSRLALAGLVGTSLGLTVLFTLQSL
ncbi:MAG: PepSY-associated TM helix domain-containing protein [Methylophilaceae bacterium]